MSNLHAGRVEEQEYYWSLDEYGVVVTDCNFDPCRFGGPKLNIIMMRQWRAMGHDVDTCTDNVAGASRCSM